ncbi:MAG: hypothetical protein A3E36_02440 [Candidatus Andersenbacteria bacterium RIFCSPHIGHO2_12_FULL_45_11b]|uniref:TrbL/VirB6 plasmid conjugal transfer protein n=1 Tax=Candidatus Andersenbacteria bacterium RIFCSPHIGHO2_12_FULL_45_11b TaxID=1797282 RepID=A0A1G1X7U5_9BACT|nr:MAG: hypothetical protein A3E36_02440 [Candidatus Andersenbacteria bacterium RIFCSPHIGHO2_12_FULL_45_11b]
MPPTANILACDEEGFAVILQYLEVISAPAKAILDITRVTLTAVDTGSKQFLNFLGSMLVTMLSQDKYITNPIVQGTWPFIQGIANLGFIIALLYIAFATTLRLDSVTTSVQRLLPKLLIAALLVNFSLVIGGLLIDVSRVIMAVEVGMVGIGQTPGDPKVFVTELIKKTNAIEAQIKLIEDSIPAVAFGSLMVRLFENSVFLILLITGLGVIVINLFVRYIALLVLLMISPLAYLFLALPKTAPYAAQWWGMFIKWVLYGPIVLFFLVIIIKVQSVSPTLPDGFTNNTSWVSFFNSIVHFIIVITLFFVAHFLGKSVAGVGSNTAMGFASKAGAWARKNPAKAAGIAFGVATGGVGAGVLAATGVAAGRYAGKGAQNAYRDVTSTAGDNLKNNQYVKKVREGLGYGLRDKEGKLLPGKSSMAGNIASWATGSLNTKQQKEIASARSLKDAGEDAMLKGLTPAQLGKGHIIEALGETKTERNINLQTIIQKGTQAQRMAIAGNKEYVAGLSGEDMQELQKTIMNSTYKAEEKEKAAVPEVKDAMGVVRQKAVPKIDAVPASGINEKDKTDLLNKISKTIEDLNK